MMERLLLDESSRLRITCNYQIDDENASHRDDEIQEQVEHFVRLD
jgi:hypothetical protein